MVMKRKQELPNNISPCFRVQIRSYGGHSNFG